jgi:UDP-N-acetylmuramoyl-tripeptide--D-alanyl-D-alanine ligase
MIKTDMQWLCRAADGQLFGDNISIESICTDTRQLTPGCLFIALKGANFDAHSLLEQAVAGGAAALLVEQRATTDTLHDIPQIVVADSRYALGQLGAAVKAAVQPLTIAITGSSGKTTVKEMLAAMLASQGNVLATAGNFNNDIGCPLTLLRLTPEHRYAVIELGANHAGEIAYTTGLTRPDVAIINNVAPAHVEGFGSVHGVFRAKTEIFRGLSADGWCFTPALSEFAPAWQQQLADRKHLTFGRDSTGPNTLYASAIELDADGCARFIAHIPAALTQGQPTRLPVQLNLPGLHNVDNALVALGAALAIGCDGIAVAQALSQLKPVPGRMNVLTLNPQLRVIDDSYNANVGSVKAAIDVLAAAPGLRILVLGDMGELGVEARHYHQHVGEHARQQGIDYVYTLGVLSQCTSDAMASAAGKHFFQLDALLEQLIATVQRANQAVTIVVKGSRSAGMERVVAALQQRQAELSHLGRQEGTHPC